MTELNLWLESYDDIFSDFDNRHYLTRRISEDFLYELRKEVKHKENHRGDLVLLLPKEHREPAAEKIISSSLKGFFTSQYKIHRYKCGRKLKNGLLLLVAGIIIMMLNAWINYYSVVSFRTTLIKVVLEPAGWFLIWAAFDFLFYDFAGLRREANFYKGLGEMHIQFKPS